MPCVWITETQQTMAKSANGRSMKPWAALVKIATRSRSAMMRAKTEGMRQGKIRCTKAAGRSRISTSAFPAAVHIAECFEPELEKTAGRRQQARQQMMAGGIAAMSSSARASASKTTEYFLSPLELKASARRPIRKEHNTKRQLKVRLRNCLRWGGGGLTRAGKCTHQKRDAKRR